MESVCFDRQTHNLLHSMLNLHIPFYFDLLPLHTQCTVMTPIIFALKHGAHTDKFIDTIERIYDEVTKLKCNN